MNIKTNNIDVSIIYNKIVKLSRYKFLYESIKIGDNFDSRINLIFIHLSFLLIKLKENYEMNKKISQKIFDYNFNQIEANIRELGFGDVAVNKKMKKFVNNFYTILLKCEKYKKMSQTEKKFFFKMLFSTTGENIATNYDKLIEYFNNFYTYSSNLSFNLIKNGDINFNH